MVKLLLSEVGNLLLTTLIISFIVLFFIVRLGNSATISLAGNEFLFSMHREGRLRNKTPLTSFQEM
ncbi:MAG: hypothetical protein ACKO6J_02165 [Crocinitomicaceae bacterium]